MKIDSSVEPYVRSGLHAAVRRDFSKLDEVLRSLPDDATVRKTIEITLAVTGFVMLDAHGGRPTDDAVRAVARKVAAVETWAEPTPAEVETFLLRLMKGEAFAGAVPTENVMILAFVVAGNLLSSCRRDNEKWWDYLDRAEAAIEAAA